MNNEARQQLISLVNALYRVTAKLPQDEILRLRLREEGLNLISHAQHLETGDKERFRQFVSSVKLLIHLCEVAHQACLSEYSRQQQKDWLDPKNFIILKHEFFKLRNLVELHQTETIPIYRGQTSSFSHISKTPQFRSRAPLGRGSGSTVPGSASSATSRPSHTKNLTPRQKKIVNHLQQSNHAQVADLSALFPKVTPRTIRRDLDKLQNQNIIKKVGNTNRVRYRLA